MTGSIGRRGFLRGVAGTMAAAAGAGSVLGGCSNGDKKQNTATANTTVPLPSYQPYPGGQKPDLPGNPSLGVQDGFLPHPVDVAHLKKVINGKPGHSGSVSALVTSYNPPPPPLSKNRYWQALNSRLGTELKVSIVPAVDWTQKLATTIAGGDLPDFLQIYQPVPDLPELLKAKFQDLTKHLSGNAVKDYPFLATIPPDYWKPCVYNGGIYGLPIPRSKMGGVLFRRDDLIDRMDLDPNPKSFSEFRQLCKELTALRHNQWALTGAPLAFVQQMLGAANNWTNDGGKLVNVNEQPQTKQALGAVADLVKAGYVHPDSFAQNNTTTLKEWFNAGNALLHYDGYTAWPGFYQENVAGPSFAAGGMLPPSFDKNSKARTWQGPLDFSFTAIRKSSQSRIKELLSIANWLVAPGNTQAGFFRSYGLSGVDYTLKNGTPVATAQGKNELNLQLGYIISGPAALGGQYTKATRGCYEFEKKFLPLSIADPTQATEGVYSNTNVEKGAGLQTAITDAQDAIMQGHKPLSSWDDAVKAWRTNGGDAIRHEFEQALQGSH